MLNFWDYVQAIAIIVAVLFGAYYVTKLVARTSTGSFRRNTGIRILGSQPLAKDRSVFVVEIGENAYILGVSAQRVELLDKQPTAQLGLPKEEPSPVLPSFAASFKDELNKRLKRFNKDD
ncbi:flagellar biosynthetic protein FliO [Oscillospiraceae bacterium WX1]